MSRICRYCNYSKDTSKSLKRTLYAIIYKKPRIRYSKENRFPICSCPDPEV